MKLKKSTIKKLLGVMGLGMGIVLLSSCTANFCSDVDRAQMAYPYEQGVTVYCNEQEYSSYTAEHPEIVEYEESIGVAGIAIPGNDKVFKYIPYEITGDGRYIKYTAAKTQYLSATIIDGAYKAGHSIPSLKYFAEIDSRVLNAALYMAYDSDSHSSEGYSPVYDVTDATKVAPAEFLTEKVLSYTEDAAKWSINAFSAPDSDAVSETSAYVEKSVLRKFGYIKFSGSNDALFGNLDHWREELYESADEMLGINGCPTTDFANYYKQAMNQKVAQNRSCIATREGQYGHYGNNANWEVRITQKTWGYAWSKGFLEGLLVYPVSWLVDTFAFSFDATLSGLGQIFALILVTLIVRGLLMAATFPSTLSQQKMQALQPEIAKLQAKYPNANTNQSEKQRLSQEQMALYRRNKIHPMAQILVMIIQFPVFICVWSGLQGSAALSSGSILNMRLSDNINTIIFNFNGAWYTNINGWWTALVLFLLMSGVQIMSMVLPRIIQKRAEKKISKMGVNSAQSDQQRQMRMMSIIMVGFTIVMGFMLPSAMGIYWLISGLLSMAQTLIIQLVVSKSKKGKVRK